MKTFREYIKESSTITSTGIYTPEKISRGIGKKIKSIQHYVYHASSKKNRQHILSKGLLPKNKNPEYHSFSAIFASTDKNKVYGKITNRNFDVWQINTKDNIWYTDPMWKWSKSKGVYTLDKVSPTNLKLIHKGKE